MRILLLLTMLSSCTLPPVVYRNPSLKDNRLHCKEYSQEHLICKQYNNCFFKEKDPYSNKRDVVASCNYYDAYNY